MDAIIYTNCHRNDNLADAFTVYNSKHLQQFFQLWSNGCNNSNNNKDNKDNHVRILQEVFIYLSMYKYIYIYIYKLIVDWLKNVFGRMCRPSWHALWVQLGRRI